jgi:hypothetical protein
MHGRKALGASHGLVLDLDLPDKTAGGFGEVGKAFRGSDWRQVAAGNEVGGQGDMSSAARFGCLPMGQTCPTPVPWGSSHPPIRGVRRQFGCRVRDTWTVASARRTGGQVICRTIPVLSQHVNSRWRANRAFSTAWRGGKTFNHTEAASTRAFEFVSNGRNQVQPPNWARATCMVSRVVGPEMRPKPLDQIDGAKRGGFPGDGIAQPRTGFQLLHFRFRSARWGRPRDSVSAGCPAAVTTMATPRRASARAQPMRR